MSVPTANAAYANAVSVPHTAYSIRFASTEQRVAKMAYTCLADCTAKAAYAMSEPHAAEPNQHLLCEYRTLHSERVGRSGHGTQSERESLVRSSIPVPA
eukprot:1290446-Rhodomonas_salina.2